MSTLAENKHSSYAETTPLVEAHPVNDHQINPSAPSEEEEIHVPSSSSNSTTEQVKMEHSSRQLKNAAGIASGVIGLFIGGPILAVVAGLAGSHAAKKDGALGDAARMFGEVALVTSEKVLHFDSKHKVSDQASRAAGQVYSKARVYDKKYNLMDKTRYYAIEIYNTVQTYAHKYKVVDHAVDKVGAVIYIALIKLAAVIPGLTAEKVKQKTEKFKKQAAAASKKKSPIKKGQ